MEQHRHIVLVVRSIEARNVDQGAAQAIPEILCIQCWLPVIAEVYRLSCAVGSLYPESVITEGKVCEGEKRQDKQQGGRP